MYIMFIAPIHLSKNASAGGEIINYYVNSFAKQGEDVTVVSRSINETVPKTVRFCGIGEEQKWDRVFFKVVKAFGWLVHPGSEFLYKTTVRTRKNVFSQLKRLKREGYCPEVVILETTSAILWHRKVKRLFPDAVCAASVHDVAYQGSGRKLEIETNPLKRILRRRYLVAAKRREVEALASVDLIVPLNEWNIALLKKNPALERGHFMALAPYYPRDYIHNDTDYNKNILFYGLMSRPENYLSAMWFIEQVMPKLPQEFKFVVMGGNPPKDLQNMASDRVKITGFLEEDKVKEYFERSFCFVAPLLLGSGIKTKVLSALAAGIPVLTNEIGIEGIAAQEGEEYLKCETPEDYVKGILWLNDNEIYLNMCQRERQMMEGKYNLEESTKKYLSTLRQLVKEGERCRNNLR